MVTKNHDNHHDWYHILKVLSLVIIAASTASLALDHCNDEDAGQDKTHQE